MCFCFIDAEEGKHIIAVEKAIKERQMVDHTIAHVVIVGSNCSGKNTLVERLFGKMPITVSPSPGVAHGATQVRKVNKKSATTAANVKESIWSVMDCDDEAIKLMYTLCSKQHENPGHLQKEQTVNGHLGSDEDYSAVVDTVIVNDNHSDNSSPTQQSPQLHESFVSPLNIFKEALRIKGLEALQQHSEGMWSLYLTNIGSQMEFQEVLPLLVSGPSIFFFTFRLDRDLNKHYTVEYVLSDGTNYVSTLSTIEGIMQTLASLSAMGTFVYKGLQRKELPLRPKVFFIGTHKDQVDGKMADDYILKVDQKLQGIIRSTAHFKDIVEFASNTQLIFAVNNFSCNDSEFKRIRSAVERVVIRDAHQMTFPAHWLIYSLAIRKLKSHVVSYNICLEVAKQCGIANQKELNEALHFIHSKMGLICYFPYEFIKDLVFISPQVLFDKVTELIVDTFTFEKVGLFHMEEFKKKGIFSVTVFERVSGSSKSCVSSSQFGKLLEILRIAISFEMNYEKKYFFPCVLAHCNNNQVTCSNTLAPPLLVSFECGYCPKGVAGALIKYLMTNEMESYSQWQFLTDGIFKNQVSFRVGPYDTVVINMLPTHIEIICSPDTQFDEQRKDCRPIKKTFNEVCKSIDTGIQQVLIDLKYVKTRHTLTFACQNIDCKNRHPAQLLLNQGSPCSLLCDSVNQCSKLPLNYSLWDLGRYSVHSADEEQCTQFTRIPQKNTPDEGHQNSMDIAHQDTVGDSVPQHGPPHCSFKGML